MEKFDPRIDAYIEKSADFAKPILTYIRNLVHEASPLVSETVKWGMPFFDYKGPVCMMAAFKQHCGFGFWKASRLNDPKHLLNPGEESSAGSFGKIFTLADLPTDAALKDFVLQAIALNEQGKSSDTIKVKKAPTEKKELTTPDDLKALMDENPKASETFAKFSPSHKKEYVEWIVDAKTDATRQKRLAQAIELMEEGKSKNWKYQK
jgi:uncharacterized protein YdeI (YjbR/CyaY-like superfamily)